MTKFILPALAREPCLGYRKRDERGKEAAGEKEPHGVQQGVLGISVANSIWGNECLPFTLRQVQRFGKLLAEMGENLLEPKGPGTGIFFSQEEPEGQRLGLLSGSRVESGSSMWASCPVSNPEPPACGPWKEAGTESSPKRAGPTVLGLSWGSATPLTTDFRGHLGIHLLPPSIFCWCSL